MTTDETTANFRRSVDHLILSALATAEEEGINPTVFIDRAIEDGLARLAEKGLIEPADQSSMSRGEHDED